MPRISEPSVICTLQFAGDVFDDLSNLIRTFLARFELGWFSSFCLCRFVEEYPVSEVDLPCSEFAIMVELSFSFIVLHFELCDKSLFFEVVEVG